MNAKQEKAIDILIDARNLLAQPYSWSKGRDMRLNSRAPGGHSYCASGALLVCFTANYPYGVNSLARDLLQKEVSDNIAVWNDARERSKAQVLAAFDRAIERGKRIWA